ncbi:MAG: radical SAM/SPASM domain-containing protein [Thermodesulfobacteriota bacterium]
MSCNYEVIHGLDFTEEEIQESLKRGGLLSLELEFTKKCNLRCVYCYSEAGESVKDELTPKEIMGVIDQAAELGARKIILLGGGEPLLYDRLHDIVDYIFHKGIEQTVFTNGFLLDSNVARFLFERDVSVVLKHNSFTRRVQDSLAGVEGAYVKIQKALANLMEAGYPEGGRQLGIQTVVVKQNIEEIPSMWVWARKMGFIPYFEVLTMQGRAKKHQEIVVSSEEIKRVFSELRDIDRREFGIEWVSHPTIASFTCKRHLYSSLVNSQGYVQPCTGIDLFVGNVRQQPLAEILGNSRVISDLRNIYNKIEGACRTCELSNICYGCRGNAYQLTGNYLASDPACWLASGQKNGWRKKSWGAG